LRYFWLEDSKKQAIIAILLKNQPEGYRRLTSIMLDAEIAAVIPASVWRVLSRTGLRRKWKSKPQRKEQPSINRRNRISIGTWT